jgi:protein-tyrosine-phosphatase
MAAGFLRKKAADGLAGSIEVASAGTAGLDGFPASDLAREVVRTDGIDLASFRSSALDARRVAEADLILVMEPRHREAVIGLRPEARGRTYLLREFADPGSGPDSSIPDPHGGDLALYRQVYRRITEAIEGCLPRIRELAARSGRG